MDTSLKRYELEDYVETQLLEIAESMMFAGPETLQAATNSFPEHFGGKFPHLGLAVVRTQGSPENLVDKPEWPGLFLVEVRIYHPCLPFRGASKPEDDRTGPARRITRRLRGMFLEDLILSRFGRHHVGLPDSRGGWIDELGGTITAEYDRKTWHLWVDRTDLPINL